jgi:hypothetical protein
LIINAEIAKAVLFEEAKRAKSEPSNPAWVKRCEELHKLCDKIAQTHIAALGTALLAKAVDVNVDVYSLKRTQGGPRAYVARALAKDVLAAYAPQLEIDIGVYGREPLNNQPYFRESRISREMPVKANARPALFYLVDILDQLDRIETPEKAREALRTYIQVRRGHFRRPLAAALAGATSIDELAKRIVAFTSSGSEGGKRAQAAAAGLLEAAFGEARVRTTRVNDPDRTLPGDVGVLISADGLGWERVFEVRDKAVTEADLHHFINKASTAGVGRVGMVSAAARQAPLDWSDLRAQTARRGMQLVVYEGWANFLSEVVFWSSAPIAQLGPEAIAAIDRRLIWFDVEPDTLTAWRRLNDIGEA